jgi:hypothetical protein
MHLNPHLSTLTSIVSVGKMAGITTYHMVACFCRDDIKQIGLTLAVNYKPLAGIIVMR